MQVLTLNTVQTVFKTKCAVPQSHANALTDIFFNNYKTKHSYGKNIKPTCPLSAFSE